LKKITPAFYRWQSPCVMQRLTRAIRPTSFAQMPSALRKHAKRYRKVGAVETNINDVTNNIIQWLIMINEREKGNILHILIWR